MHLLTLSEPVNLGKTIGTLKPGQWLMHDINAFEIAQRAPRGSAKVSELVSNERPDSPLLPALIMRSGAIGDLLLLTPVLKEWKIKTGRQLAICCFPHHFEVLAGCPYIDQFVPYPLDAKRASEFCEIISLENTMEVDHKNHATDVFAKALDVPPPLPSYRPFYTVFEPEIEEAKKHLFTNRPNLIVQPRASVPNRDYPMHQWGEVIVRLEKQGWGILLVGHKGQLPPIPADRQNPFIRDLSQIDMTFRQVAAIVSQSRAVLGVDSAMLHLAAALDIPAVGLFGPFDWKTRTSHAPKTIALTGVGECAPCSWHLHAGRAFPPNKPCSQIGQCVVLAGITPERICAKVALLKP